MDAPAEGNVAVVGARDVEAVRVGKLSRIAVGGADERHHQLALADRVAAQLDVLARDARRALHRAVVAQQLFHGAGDEPGALAQPAELRGMAQERQGAVADQVDRGLVAGDEQEDAVESSSSSVSVTPRSSAWTMAVSRSSRGWARRSAMRPWK